VLHDGAENTGQKELHDRAVNTSRTRQALHNGAVDAGRHKVIRIRGASTPRERVKELITSNRRTNLVLRAQN
jgi:hypothetical protein